MKTVVIGGAWPYANGSLHIGHIAALLPGDVLARYYRAKGAKVFYVSGSDCYGTPITIRAQQESTTPEAISERYHREFCEVFQALGFSYDRYLKTTDETHRNFVQAFHRTLYQSNTIEERVVQQAYCETCKSVLTDRMVIGFCPQCGKATRAEQCEFCGELLEAEHLKEPCCAECHTPVSFRRSKHLFLKMSAWSEQIEQHVRAHPYWRKNAISFTNRYLSEGLPDRALTRDLRWGIPVPKEGYENKCIYIWAENVLGYFSAVSSLCEQHGENFTDIVGRSSDTMTYYVHGKDNIPFHSIILPALLLAHGGQFRLPDQIISSEHVTLEGKKISTSKNWAVWVKDLVQKVQPDEIRYFFIANGPEKRDSDFSFREFHEKVHSELIGIWGNFVNRTLAFSNRYFDGEIPQEEIEREVKERIKSIFECVGESIEHGAFKEALFKAMEGARFANRYYDGKAPWKTRLNDVGNCRKTIANCFYLVANLSVQFAPFLPFSSEKIQRWLGIENRWEQQTPVKPFLSGSEGILFEKFDGSAFSQDLIER